MNNTLSKVRVQNICIVIALITLVICFSGCARGYHYPDFAKVFPAARSQAGIFSGLFHGITLPFSLIGSLLSDDYGIYELYNTGFMYDLGFAVGAWVIFTAPYFQMLAEAGAAQTLKEAKEKKAKEKKAKEKKAKEKMAKEKKAKEKKQLMMMGLTQQQQTLDATKSLRHNRLPEQPQPPVPLPPQQLRAFSDVNPLSKNNIEGSEIMVDCQNCGMTAAVPSAMAGRSAKCKCGSTITIPSN